MADPTADRVLERMKGFDARGRVSDPYPQPVHRPSPTGLTMFRTAVRNVLAPRPGC
ncbi:hypothetical protein SRIMM317S_06821 [Streptomyces rimosus subsp. rimosus]